jgi:hypothetical protein
VGNGFHLGEELTAETRRSQRDAELRWEVVDEALDAVFEEHGPEIDKESEMVVGHA